MNCSMRQSFRRVITLDGHGESSVPGTRNVNPPLVWKVGPLVVQAGRSASLTACTPVAFGIAHGTPVHAAIGRGGA